MPGSEVPKIQEDLLKFDKLFTSSDSQKHAELMALHKRISELPDGPGKERLLWMIRDMEDDGEINLSISEAHDAAHEQQEDLKQDIEYPANINHTYHPEVEKYAHEGIVLTDDDGPRAGTLELGKIAQERGVTVMFFVNRFNGDRSEISVPRVGNWHENVATLLRQGHQVYSHTAGHTYFDKKNVTIEELTYEIDQTMAMEDELRLLYEKAGRGDEYADQVSRGVRFIRFGGEGNLEALKSSGDPDKIALYDRFVTWLQENGMTRLTWTSGGVINTGDELSGLMKKRKQSEQTQSAIVLTHVRGGGSKDSDGKKVLDALAGDKAQDAQEEKKNTLEKKEVEIQTKDCLITKEMSSYYRVWLNHGKPLGYEPDKYYEVLDALNPQVGRDELRVGKTKLQIPTTYFLKDEIPATLDDQDKPKNDQEQKREVPEEKDKANASKESIKLIQHTIKAGESISKIAARYGTTIDEILKHNIIADPDSVGVGLKLNIPVSSERVGSPSESVEIVPLGFHENLIQQEFFRQGYTNSQQLAYILATGFHETLRWKKMVEMASGAAYEWRKDLGNTQKGDGVRFKGRGLAMLTGRLGYTKYSRLCYENGMIDTADGLIKDPSLATRPDIAAYVIVHGMMTGHFTGKKLPKYINDQKTNYRLARKTVNGMDRADMIAGYARGYQRKLSSEPSAPESKDSGIYLVQAGDTLFRIAREHHMDVNELKEKNGLKEDAINVGQRLRVGQGT